jgi:hypothetical protein
MPIKNAKTKKYSKTGGTEISLERLEKIYSDNESNPRHSNTFFKSIKKVLLYISDPILSYCILHDAYVSWLGY